MKTFYVKLENVASFNLVFNKAQIISFHKGILLMHGEGFTDERAF